MILQTAAVAQVGGERDQSFYNLSVSYFHGESFNKNGGKKNIFFINVTYCNFKVMDILCSRLMFFKINLMLKLSEKQSERQENTYPLRCSSEQTFSAVTKSHCNLEQRGGFYSNARHLTYTLLLLPKSEIGARSLVGETVMGGER